jgi:pyruvate formate lyase activating enzyme
VIERDWHEIGAYHLKADRCGFCGQRIDGHFDETHGTWGRRRLPIAPLDVL